MPKRTKREIPPLPGRDDDWLKVVAPAASTGKLPALAAYLEERPEFEHLIGPHGRTLLWEAARKGKQDVVEFLAERGADLNAWGCYHRETTVEVSPWCIATLRKKRKTADWLAERATSWDVFSASRIGDLERVQSFVEEDPACVEREYVRKHRWNPYSARPIENAVAGGHLDIVRFLLEHGAQLHDRGGRLVRWAVWSESEELVELLIEAGADPLEAGLCDWATDPQWRAFAKRHAIPIDVDAPDNNGFPPIVDEARGNHNAPDEPARIQELLDLGANVNVRDHKGKTALHRAAQAGFIEITKLLLAEGAELEARDLKEETPLFDAVRAGRPEALALLIENGADVGAENRLGQTPSFLAGRSKKPRADEVGEILARATAKS